MCKRQTDCDVFHWRAGLWNACAVHNRTANCGSGFKKREAICVMSNQATEVIAREVPDWRCQGKLTFSFSFFVLFCFSRQNVNFHQTLLIHISNVIIIHVCLQAWNYQCWKTRVLNIARRTAKSLNGAHGLHAKISVVVVGVQVIPILPWQQPRRLPRQCPPPLL